jgi:hypothetical protein
MMIMLDARARDGEEQKENEKDDRERGRERERERGERREETRRERENHGEEQIKQIHRSLASDNLIVAQMRFWWAGQEKCRSQARPMRTLTDSYLHVLYEYRL